MFGDDQMVFEWLQKETFKPYTSKQLEQAFWHLWTLNCYHITGSFDVNMTLLLDWAIQFHLEGKK